MSGIIVLSGLSKIKSIECTLGSPYDTSACSIHFGLLPVPESVKTKMDFLIHSISSSLEGRVVPAEASSDAAISEGANLFEEAEKASQALADRATFVSCADAERISQVISESLQVKMQVHKMANLAHNRIVQQHCIAAFQQFARVFLREISRTLGVSVSNDEREALEISIPLRTSSLAQAELTEDQRFMATSLEIRTIEVFTKVIELLREEEFLSKKDMDLILQSSLKTEIEKRSAFQSTISYTLSSDQISVMKDFFDVHISSIIDRCIELDTPDKVLGKAVSWQNFQGPVVARDIAFAALVHCAAQGYSTLIFEQFEGLAEREVHAQMLNDIYQGITGFEDLLKEYRVDVPSLELQRAFLFTCFEEQLEKRFGPENFPKISDEFDPDLVRELRKRLFVDGYYLNMIEPTEFDQLLMHTNEDHLFGPAYIHPMSINTFSGTMRALQGDFLEYSWFPTDVGYVQGEAAVERFAAMRAKVEANLASPEAASSS